MRIRLKNGSGVTVKAEDRPSGSAGDSASVSAPFFRISVSVVVRGVCLSRRREAPALSYQDKHTPRLQIDFSEVVYRDYFICFGQRDQLIVKADNTTCAAFHVWDIVELLESRYVLFVRIGVLFYLNGI